jgi:arylsulfatase A-like enzyme
MAESTTDRDASRQERLSMSDRHLKSGTIPTAIIVGLGWGLLVSLLDGLALLLEGSFLPHLGPRLLALAYTAAIYGTLGALAGGLLGCFAWIFLRLTHRQVSRAWLAATFASLLAAATAAALWLHRYQPRLIGWLVVLLLAAAVGLAVRWLLVRATRGGALSWPAFRALVVGLYLVAVVAVLAAAGYRAWLRDLPAFNPPASGQTATAEQPNIVLITASGVRADHLGAYGYDPEISPNINALAQRGLRFEQALAQASWTEPSLASLLTSLYPSELGINCRAAISCQPHLDEARTTLAEALQSAGYHTAAYLTDPWLTPELGFDQGFHQFKSVRAQEPFDRGPLRSRTLGWLLGCGRDSATCRLFLEGHARLFDDPIPAGWGGDQVNARAARFLDLHGDERFFLWVHYSESLPPYDLEPPFRPMPEGPLASQERELRAMGYWRLGDPFAPREKLLPLDVEGLTALYDGEVHRVDRLVGGLSGQLEARGLADRTLVVFASDHGQEFLDHGLYTYGHSLYDEVQRVPLIFAGPGVASPGSAVDTPAALLDLAPTLQEVAGAPVPAEAKGRSLTPALRGQAPKEVPVYAESMYRVPEELKALRRGGYKLIYNVDDGQFVLYDLDADPAELQDVAAEAPEVADAMLSELLGWMEHTSQVAHELPRAAPPREFPNAVW